MSTPPSEAHAITRTATPDDLPAVQRLYRLLDEEHVRLLPGVFQPVNGDARSDALVLEQIEGEGSDILVAVADSAVIGLAEMRVSHFPDVAVYRPGSFAYVDALIVEPDRQRRGVGRLLMRAASDWALARGLGSLWTNVWHANRAAVQFYEALGFSAATTRFRMDLKPDEAGRSDPPAWREAP